MRFALLWPAAAKPYPGEAPTLPESPGPSSPRRAGAHGCTSLNKAQQLCSGNAGPDGRCARHKG